MTNYNNFDFNFENDQFDSFNPPKNNRPKRKIKDNDFNAHILEHKIIENFSRDSKLIANPIQKRLESLPLQEVSFFTISLLIWYTNNLGIFNSIYNFYNEQAIKNLAQQQVLAQNLPLTEVNKEAASEQMIDLVNNYAELIESEQNLNLDTIYQKFIAIANDLFKPSFEAKYTDVVDQIVDQFELESGINIDFTNSNSNNLYVSQILQGFYDNVIYLITSTAEALISKDLEQMVFNAQVLSLLHIYQARNVAELLTFKKLDTDEYIKSDLYNKVIDSQWDLYRSLEDKFIDPKTQQRKHKLVTSVKSDSLIDLLYEQQLPNFSKINLEIVKLIDNKTITTEYTNSTITSLSNDNFNLDNQALASLNLTTEDFNQLKLNYVTTCQAIYDAFLENTKDLLEND